jgi:hypothetical protein
VKELDGQSTIKVYPNPTSGKFVLNAQLPRRLDVVIRILDATGRLLYERRVEQTEALLEEFQLHSPGFYIVEVIAEGERLSLPVIVQQQR